MRPRIRRLLLGRNRTLTRWYLAVAAGVFVASVATLGLVGSLSRRGVRVPLDGFWVAWAVALLVVGLPTIQAYRNDGLLVSVALGVAAPLAFYLVLTAFDLVVPSESVLWGVGTALLFGVPAGVLGFLVGAGSARLRRRVD